MANSVGLRFNNIEEERVLGAMLAAGDENVSTHIKRVYFQALDLAERHHDEVSVELQDIQHQIGILQAMQAAPSAQAANDPTLKLLCNLYSMVRDSVATPLRLQADVHINIQAIEEYLKPTPQDDENARAIDATSPDGTGRSGGGHRVTTISPNVY